MIDSGRFLPMGGHKGSSLAFMVELLTAGLANGLLCYEQGTLQRPSDTAGGSTKLFIAIRPFGDWLHERLEDLKAHLRGCLFSLEGGDIHLARKRLRENPEILSSTQIGMSLRVIVNRSVADGRPLLETLLSDCSVEIRQVAPAIEDVFVMTTKANGGSIIV